MLDAAQECGIISDSSALAEVKTEEEPGAGSEGSPGHRVLIFAQLKAYLDIVEADVLAPAGISYLRLDGRCGIYCKCKQHSSLDHAGNHRIFALAPSLPNEC